MKSLSETRILIRALKLYINIHNFVYDIDGVDNSLCDYLKAADILADLKQQERAALEALTNEQESL